MFPVGSPFRLRVSQYLDPATFPAPATSNRTCGFPASGFLTDVTPRHTSQGLRLDVKPLPDTPGLVYLEGIGLRHSPTLVSFHRMSEVRPLPSTGITRLPRYYRPVRHPKPPSLALAGYRLVALTHHDWGFPCCAPSPLPHMPSPLPRRNHEVRTSLSSLAMAAFPHLRAGRLPHYTFRGLLSVHCSLRPAWSPSCPRQPSTPEASAISLPPLLLRLLPAGATDAGWGSHPLKMCAFARHTANILLSAMEPHDTSVQKEACAVSARGPGWGERVT